jgi:putative pre-16S rRNA nuclease
MKNTEGCRCLSIHQRVCDNSLSSILLPDPRSSASPGVRQMSSPQSSSPTSGRLAGVDFGTVRIGVAVTDREQRIASPFDNYTRRGEAADAEYFQRLVKDEQIARFVVGLPVHLDGRESQKSLEARQFGRWLQDITGTQVVFFDERFTSTEAEQALAAADLTKKQRKARLDKLAAQILLTAYLEAGKPPSFEVRGIGE